MSFWDKKGEKNVSADDKSLDASGLLDVSNLNVPDSDNNDQYGEDVLAESKKKPTFPSFLDNTKKAMDLPQPPTGKKPVFMAPPIPKAPLPSAPSDLLSQEDDGLLPFPPEEESTDEYDDLPPLPLDDETDEYDDLPPLEEDEEVEETDDLPPLPLDDEADTYDDLPPLEEDEAVEETDDLPPLPMNDETDAYDDLPLLEEDEEVNKADADLTTLEEVEDVDLASLDATVESKEKEEIEKEEEQKPLAQAPRSNTFEKHEEFIVEEPKESTDEKSEENTQVSNKKNDENEPLHYTNPLFLRKLFANGNTCITAPGATFQLKEDLRSLLALFSNGRYFVAETYKYDGKVLSFEYLVKKRNLQIGKPEYVPMNVLNTIYEYAAQNTYAEDEEEETEKADVVEQAQARMQRDFITIVSRAAAMHVSDIHVVVAENTIVMFRVNGLMQTEMEYKKEWGESFVRAAFASADISDANYAQNEYQAAQKLGRTPLRGSHGKLVLPKNILGIRLQFNPIAFGTRYVVLRLLYAEENMETTSALEALGFTKKDTEDFYKLRGTPTGITIISGPTGSGKSTTLQRNMIAMLQERNYEVNLITVEDPPEYPIPGARQMPVTNATIEEAKEREFTKALAAALRSDPDSMMIGEIRTLSAADLAFRAALSGHNVWTTLHANNAPSILIRLKDMGVEEFKLKDPEIIQGLTAQRLFRRLCPHCRIPALNMLKSPIVQRLREGFGDIALETTFLRGNGCKQCDFKGVKGRIAVSEIILPDATFLDLMMKGETIKATNYWINELNGTTLRESALRHMFNGIIDIGEVERWTGFLNQTITS